MSTIGGGLIFAMLATSLAGAAALAAVAVAVPVVLGGVLASQLGKGLVVCGQAVKEALEARAQQQRAIYRLCRAYEDHIRQLAQRGVEAERRGRLEGQRARRADQQRRLAAVRQRPLPAWPAVEPLPREDLGLEPAPPPTVRLVSLDDLRTQAERLSQNRVALADEVRTLRADTWADLFDLSSLEERLAHVGSQLQVIVADLKPRSDVAPVMPEVTQANLLAAETDLAALRREVQNLKAEAPRRWEERQRALGALLQAHQRLDHLETQVGEHPELTAGLEVAAALLEDAERALEAGDTVTGYQTALAVEAYAEDLARLPQVARRANLQAGLEALDTFLEETLGVSADHEHTRRRIAKAQEALSAGRLDEAWELLQEAQAAADRLVEETAVAVQEAQRDTIARLARQALTEMGYTITGPKPEPGGALRLTAQRADGPSFIVTISPEGRMQYQAERFGSAECQAQAREFFERLRAQGVQMETQTDFRLETTLSRVREALLRQGFTTIVEQPTSQGVLLEARRGERRRAWHVDYDGNATPPAEEEVEKSKSLQDEEEAMRRAQAEWQERRLVQLRQEMEARRIRV